MKKKLLNILLCISIIGTMFVPIATNAVPDNNMNLTFAWNCNNGSLCLQGLTVTKFNAESNYRTNYYNDYDIIDSGFAFSAADASSYGKANYKQQYYIFKGTHLDEIRSLYHGRWAELDEAAHEDIQNMPYEPIDPCGGVDGPHSVSHNGDREFRLVIRDRDYVPITFNVEREGNGYFYYLGEWDPIFKNPEYDISGTTKAKPLEYKTFIQESRLMFRMENLKSVKALDVPKKSVNIQVVDSAAATIEFKSNYYNAVTFEIELLDGSKYYLKVNRVFVEYADNAELVMRGVETTRKSYVKLLYADYYTYNDFEVYATITTSTGTVFKKLEAVNSKEVNPAFNPEHDDPSDEYFEGYERSAGTNIKKAMFGLDIDNNVQSVSINVIFARALELEEFGGTYGGTGEGVQLDLTNFKRMMNDRRN